jgi:hypothetical protein
VAGLQSGRCERGRARGSTTADQAARTQAERARPGAGFEEPAIPVVARAMTRATTATRPSPEGCESSRRRCARRADPPATG